jgi:hypothetical protein
MDKYANIKAIFFTEGLVNALRESTLEYKHELKFTVNNLRKLYNTKVSKDMVKMYENHEEAFETISDLNEKIGAEYAKIDPSKYGMFLEVVQKFNSGELFEKPTNE